jgi:PAS domain S-box-containing protein
MSLRDVIDRLPVSIYIKDRKSRFLYINRACAAYFKLTTPKGACGLTDRDIFTADHADEARRDELEVMQSGRPLIDKEEQETWPGGRRTWVLTSKLPLRNARGEIVGTFGISKDITRTKEELERYRLAVEAAQDGLWHRNFQKKEIWFSPRWKEILGLRDDEMGDELKEWKDRVHPDDHDLVEDAFWEHCLGHTLNFECEFRMRHRDGSYRWIRARGKATRDAKGKLEAFAGSSTDITASKDREGFYQHVLDAIPSLVFVKDGDLRFTYVNRAVEEALSLPREQILGRTDADINPDPQQVAQFRADDLKVLRERKELEISEEILTDAAGEHERILATKKVPLVGPSGSPDAPVQVLGVATDITALRQARQDLEYERELLHSLMNNVPDGIFFKDREGRFIRANRALAQLVGYDDPSQLVGKTDADLLGEDYAKDSREEERRIFETGESVLNIVRETPTAEGPRWRLVNKVPIPNKDGQVIQIVGVSKDITERKRAEDELRKQTELLGGILDQLPQSIFVKDRDGVFQMCNRSFAAWHGYESPEQIIGKADSLHLRTEEADRYRRDDQFVMGNDQPKLRYRDEQHRPDGGIAILETSKIPLHDEHKNVVAVLSIFEDITDRLNAETERLQQEKRRLHDDITRSIGHCLKNQIATLEASRLALEKYSGKSEPLDLMKDTIGFLKHAIQIALSFERFDAGMDRTRLSIDEILRSLAREVRDPRIRLGEVPGSVLVEGDSFHLKNALLELLRNALDFVPPPDQGGWIRVWIEAHGDHCSVHIEDNGPGIPEHLRDRLFERFLRGNPSRTGMGLAYVRRVVQEHEGTVEPIYATGRGAHFVVHLPIHHIEEGHP